MLMSRIIHNFRKSDPQIRHFYTQFLFIGSLEDSGDVGITFDFVTIKVYVWRLYPENIKSFELYPFSLFHLGGTVPGLSYGAQPKFEK